MRRGTVALLAVILFIVLLLAPTLVRRVQFFALSAPERADVPVFTPAEDVPIVTTPAGERFVAEDLTVEAGRVLLDVAHDNNFTDSDVAYLDEVLALRGYDLVPFSGGSLQSALRSAAAFVVVTPLSAYSAREITTIKAYVERGGRLLLVGDPSRFGLRFEETDFDFTVVIDTDDIVLNSIANEFDVIFNGDYAFNVSENEGNFRNIVFTGDGLGATPLTDGLDSVVLYGTHTLTVGGDGAAVLIGDGNTSSSVVDRPGGLITAALSGNGRVLSLGDLQFMTAPYFTTFDNGAFIARIADFLTDQAQRTFVVGDFPFFFGSDVDLVYTGQPDLGPDTFAKVIALQDAFNGVDINVALAAEPQRGNDTLYLGLYNQADETVTDLLASVGISLTIDPPILTAAELAAATEAAGADTGADDEAADETVDSSVRRLIQTSQGNIQMAGTALIFLNETDSHKTVVVLAASSAGLNATFDRLLDLIPRNATYALEDCLLEDNLALCPTGIADEEVEAELVTGAAPASPPPGEEDTPPGDEEGGIYDEALDAYIQGIIGVDFSVEGDMGAGEAHGWVFNSGPALLDVTLEVSEEVDGVIEVYDPDNALLASVDNTFSGETELLRNVAIPDDGSYTIVVRDFFGEPGSYTLTLTESAGLSGSILLVVDDDGVPQAGGFNSAAVIVDALGDNYEISLWSTAADGPLEESLFAGVSLVILDSGDYRLEEGFGDDEFLILNYVNSGGNLLINGATPTLFDVPDNTIVTLEDVEVAADSPLVLPSFSPGDVLVLEQSIDVFELPADDISVGDTVFMLHGPASSAAGSVVGVSFQDEASGGNITVLFVPFALLPADARDAVLLDLVSWFGLSVE